METSSDQDGSRIAQIKVHVAANPILPHLGQKHLHRKDVSAIQKVNGGEWSGLEGFAQEVPHSLPAQRPCANNLLSNHATL